MNGMNVRIKQAVVSFQALSLSRQDLEGNRETHQL